MFGFILLILTVSTILLISLFKKKNKLNDFGLRRNPFVRKEPFVKVFGLNPSNKCIVTPDNTPLHLKRGWTHKAGEYYGSYRTQYGAWKGVIGRKGDIFIVYIYDPPTEKLESHKRWICFHHENGKKWRIKLAINPTDKDVGAIIFYVENIIIESFQKT